MSVGSFLSVRSLYSFWPCLKSTWRRLASYRLTWPLIMFSQVGALESVKHVSPLSLMSFGLGTKLGRGST